MNGSAETRDALRSEVLQRILARLPSDADVDGQVTAVVDGLQLGAAGASSLAQYLRRNDDALVSGRSDGPPQRLRLLQQLAPLLPGQVRPAQCVGCAKTGQLVRRLHGQRACGSCYARSRRCLCVRCGQDGIIALKDGDGYLCRFCFNRDTSRWEPCTGCGKTARVVQRKAGLPLCQTCADRRTHTCSRCGHPEQKAHANGPDGPLCSACYHRQRVTECVTCHVVSAEVHRRPDTGTWLCATCWQPDPVECTRCGQTKIIKASLGGSPVCGSCRAQTRPRRRCVECGQTKKVHSRLVHGPVCGSCYSRLRDHPGPCASCALVRPLIGRGQDGRPTCGPCAGDQRDWTCRQCGRFAALFADRRCRACVARVRLQARLTRTDGSIHPQLAPVLDLFDVDTNPQAMLVWLHGSEWGRELGRLAQTTETITHAVLDQQPPTARIVHLRAVLTYAGVLPERDEYVESTVAWVNRFLASQPEETAAVLRRYATWSVLRRARRRAQRRHTTRSVTKYNRNLVTLAAALMEWLASESLTLADLNQTDLDTWLTAGSQNRQRIRDFVRWTHAQGLTRQLHVPVGARTQPHEFLDDSRRWQILRRCASDPSLGLEARAGAALVLLFGLTATRVTRLTTADVQSRGGRTYIAVGTSPLLLPDSIATLITDLAKAATNHRPPVVGNRASTNPWLFPGALSDRHMQPATLASRIRAEFDLKVRPARNAALCDLAQDMPASVLADLLGLQIEAALRWTALVKTDWSAYLAARIEAVESAAADPE